MPIYEYRCSSCGHELEAMQKFSDAPLVACPSCNTDGLVKLVSAAGFQLKGSGWYATDFRNGGKKPTRTTTDGASAEGAKGDGAKGDGAKPAETAAGATADAGTGSSTPASGCGSGCACH